MKSSQTQGWAVVPVPQIPGIETGTQSHCPAGPDLSRRSLFPVGPGQKSAGRADRDKFSRDCPAWLSRGRSGTGTKIYKYIINLLLFNLNNYERSSDTKSCSFCSISQQWSISQDWWVALLRPVSQLFTLEIKKTCLIRFHPKTLTKISKSKIENLKKFETHLKLTTTNHIFMLINDILFSESFSGILVLRSWTSSLSLWFKILLVAK